MQRRLLIALAPLMILSSTADASEDKKASTKDVGQYVEMQPMAIPIIVKGELINYVFVYVRLNLTTSADVAKLRQKEPFFRDALVRAAHRTPFVLPNDYQKVDEARLIASVMRDATAIVGPGQIKAVLITSQAPQKHVAQPRPAPQAHS